MPPSQLQASPQVGACVACELRSEPRFDAPRLTNQGNAHSSIHPWGRGASELRIKRLQAHKRAPDLSRRQLHGAEED